jgi:hypothetical protein
MQLVQTNWTTPFYLVRFRNMSKNAAFVWIAAAALALLLLACGGPDAAPEVPPRSGAALRNSGYALRRAPRFDSDAPPRDTLRISRAFGDSLAFARIVKLYAFPGKLLGLDQLLQYHLTTIDLNDGAIQHFGRHGEGPREMRTPFSASLRPGSDEVWVYDFDLNRFNVLDLRGAEPEFRRTAPAPGGVRLLDPVVGKELISNVLSADATLLIGPAGERNGHRLINLGLPFDSASHPAQVARRLLNRTFMGSSPDGERFAIAYQFIPRVEIVSRGGEHLATALGPRDGHPSYRMQDGRFFWNDDNLSLYTGVAASDRHVYVLYCGCRFAAAQEMRAVHVFDWNGNFVKELAFDRPVNAIAVTPDDGLLYGAVEEPHPSIVEWRLTGAPPAGR